MHEHSLDPGRPLSAYLLPTPSRYLESPAPGQEITQSGASDAIDGLLVARRHGLEEMASELGGLIEKRREATRSILKALDRDQLYLENLILDRYDPTARPTDDRVYVTLRLQQLRLEHERREEERSFWRDTVLLAKERGELLRRVEEARSREDLLSGGWYR